MVARARPARPRDHRARRSHHRRAAGRDRVGRGARTRTRGSRARPSRVRNARSSPSFARPTSSSANHERSRTRSSSTSTATSRSRSSRRASGTSATAVATKTCATSCWPAAPSSTGCPPYMQGRYESWVRGLNGDWLVSRQRFFGVPIPLWYALDGDGEPVWDRPIVPSEDTLPVDPSSRRAARLQRRAAGQAARFRGRSRRDGHLGHLFAHAPDRVPVGGRRRPVPPHLPDGPASAGPRHHPHVALLDRGARAPRTPQPAVDQRRVVGVDPRPRSQEDVEVQGQRRHAHAPARAVRLRRGALLVARRAARAPTPRSTKGR